MSGWSPEWSDDVGGRTEEEVLGVDVHRWRTLRSPRPPFGYDALQVFDAAAAGTAAAGDQVVVVVAADHHSQLGREQGEDSSAGRGSSPLGRQCSRDRCEAIIN